ncbi:MAG: twin-arginine translocase TatA/TatE family subunit [Bacteroidetes bacterium]|nr:MAG: twin-arginine translocase TatA/TatE family subunit [Bacteroidota bacterium]
MNSNILLWIPGGTEVIIILIVVILLFGAKKIPELMKGVGKGIKEFKKATSKEPDSDKEISENKD